MHIKHKIIANLQDLLPDMSMSELIMSFTFLLHVISIMPHHKSSQQAKYQIKNEFPYCCLILSTVLKLLLLTVYTPQLFHNLYLLRVDGTCWVLGNLGGWRRASRLKGFHVLPTLGRVSLMILQAFLERLNLAKRELLLKLLLLHVHSLAKPYRPLKFNFASGSSKL